jgi:Asp-tRNA(Asn)/Glu-tRNA(Gln) amidotransferase A subunit family amidase
VLGKPVGPYLEQASLGALEAYAKQLVQLSQAGYEIIPVELMPDVAQINRQHTRMVFAEMAEAHTSWFAEYRGLYRPRTAAALLEGQTVSETEHAEAQAGRLVLRETIAARMAETGVDVWVCPATTGTAPAGLESTGSPIMNLPWTYAGLPAITFPAGRAENGLPYGLQCVGRFNRDEELLMEVAPMAEIFREFRR